VFGGGIHERLFWEEFNGILFLALSLHALCGENVSLLVPLLLDQSLTSSGFRPFLFLFFIFILFYFLYIRRGRARVVVAFDH
jgi:hypothetical protein